MIPRFYLIVAVIFAVAAPIIWFVFLRPVPIHSATGTIRGKTFQESGTYWQGHQGLSRGFRTPTPIEIADAYVFEIDVNGFAEPLRYAVNTTAAEQFAIGDPVRIEYQSRGVPPFWIRVYVLTMETAR